MKSQLSFHKWKNPKWFPNKVSRIQDQNFIISYSFKVLLHIKQQNKTPSTVVANTFRKMFLLSKFIFCSCVSKGLNIGLVTCVNRAPITGFKYRQPIIFHDFRTILNNKRSLASLCITNNPPNFSAFSNTESKYRQWKSVWYCRFFFLIGDIWAGKVNN